MGSQTEQLRSGTANGASAASRSHRPAIAILAAVSVAAAALIWWATSYGAGMSPDSLIYVGMAKSILAGHGFTLDSLPVTHFPPVYPLLLAGTGFFTGDVVLAARVLGAILFAVNLALFGWTAYVIAGHRMRAMTIAVPMLAASGSVLYLHAMAWSEAPFFLFALGGFLAITLWVTRRHRYLLCVGSALLGLAIATRYVGITLLVPLAVAIFFLGERTFKQRSRDFILAAALALAPLGAWIVRNAMVSHQGTDRTLAMHLVTGEMLQQMVATLSDFILPVVPDSWKAMPVVAVALVLVAGLISISRNGMRRISAPSSAVTMLVLCVAFVASYIGFLLFSVSFLDATTPLDDRILFPVFGMVVLGLVALTSAQAATRKEPRLWWALALFAAISVVVRLPAAVTTMQVTNRDGIGYESVTWRDSDMLDQVRQLPAAMIIYSNASDAIEFLAGRPAHWLPDSMIWESGRANPAFPNDRDAMCRNVIAGTAVVAYFNTDDPGDEWALDQTNRLCTFPNMVRRIDGAFYSAGSVKIIPAAARP